jgi:hypothetical protein
MAKIGIKTIAAIIIEWVSPLCSRNGINRSMSGMMDSVRIMGMFKLVFSAFAEVLLRTYPRAKWPTANNMLSLLGNKKSLK